MSKIKRGELQIVADDLQLSQHPSVGRFCYINLITLPYAVLQPGTKLCALQSMKVINQSLMVFLILNKHRALAAD